MWLQWTTSSNHDFMTSILLSNRFCIYDIPMMDKLSLQHSNLWWTALYVRHPYDGQVLPTTHETITDDSIYDGRLCMYNIYMMDKLSPQHRRPQQMTLSTTLWNPLRSFASFNLQEILLYRVQTPYLMWKPLNP